MIKKVCILESSYIVNEGLQNIVTKLNGFMVAACFSTFSEAEKSAELATCDVLLCNPDLIRNSQSLVKLKLLHHNLKILMVDQERQKFRIFFTPASVHGYIFLCCHTEEVLKAILAVSRNEKFFCDKALGYMLAPNEKLSSCGAVNLSERELEILKLITQGLSSREISEKLSVSFHTVNTHRKNICKKLKVNKVSELIAVAHKLKLM